MNAGKRAVIGGVVFAVTIVGAAAARAQSSGGHGGEARPRVAVLHLAESDVLAGFTPEVRTQANLRDRALALWRTHFAAQAATIRQRFAHEDDWRPALADAAALVDDFLEASLLPRAQQWDAGAGKVWVEKLDPATGQRTRQLQAAPARRVFIAPESFVPKSPDEDADKPVPKPAR
jgi:hypothetical protein